MSCQRRTRTPIGRATTGGPSVGRSGSGTATGARTPTSGLRTRRPDRLDDRGMASPARLERATSAFGGRRSAPAELRRGGVDGRGRTCILWVRNPVPSPLGHVDVVRVLGLEPSLFRGKSPVPYQSGVARVVGRGGIEPPVSEDGWSTASCAPWRDRPIAEARWRWPRRRCLCSCQGATSGLAVRHEGQARKVSNPRPSVLETATPPLARALVCCTHDVVRADLLTVPQVSRRASSYLRPTGRPTLAGCRRPGVPS